MEAGMSSGALRSRLKADSGDAVGRAAESTTADRLGQLGLLSRALVFLVIAALSVKIVRGDSTQTADSQGAFQTISSQPLGRAALAVVALGFAGHGIWRLLEATSGLRRDAGAKRTLKRLWFAIVGVLYLILCVSTVRVIAGQENGSEDRQSQQATSSLLGIPGGRAVLFIAGLAVIGTSVGVAVWALSGSFLQRLHVEELGPPARPAVRWFGAAGQTARALVIAAVGVLLLDAAVTDEAGRAQGLDGTLKALASTPYGSILLVVVTVGLAVFGAYSVVEAALLRTTHDEAPQSRRRPEGAG
jgi:hypothetical protein